MPNIGCESHLGPVDWNVVLLSRANQQIYLRKRALATLSCHLGVNRTGTAISGSVRVIERSLLVWSNEDVLQTSPPAVLGQSCEFSRSPITHSFLS